MVNRPLIMETCPCNKQQFFQLKKMKISFEKKSLDIFNIFAQNIVGTHC